MSQSSIALVPAIYRFWNGVVSLKRTAKGRLIARLHEVARRCSEGDNDFVALLAWALVLALDPHDPQAVSLTSNRLVQRGLRDQAKEFLRRRVADYPRDFQARLDLVRLYQAPFDAEAMEEQLRAAAAIEPDHPQVLFMTAVLHRLNSRLADSNACLENLFKKADYDCEFRCLYAENLIDQGKVGAAVEVLEEAVGLHPRCPGAYRILASLKYYKEPSHPHIRRIREMLDEGDVPREAARTFHSTLCRVFDSLGSWDYAFKHARMSNELAGYVFHIGRTEQIAGLTKSIFDGSFMANMLDRNRGRRSVGRHLIFIVGMPRSGSTLTEQILASHPDVVGGGEREDIASFVEELPRLLGRRKRYPGCIRRIDPDEIDRFAAMHLEKVSRAAGGASVFVDKSLSNYMYVGLISLLFPGAKIVHCRRNPLDTCLSCYFQSFEAVTFTHDIILLGKMYNIYRDIMCHWNTHLGGVILDFQYENLVGNPGEMVKRLLDFCELPYDERCMSFYKTERVAHTASSVQVKSPIYSSSVGRWRNYRRHLQPLIDILGGEAIAHGTG